MEEIKHPYNYENYELCSLCRGKCCQNLPGQYSPADFNEPITYEFVKSLLGSGKIAIDWVEGGLGEREIYYLRPRTVRGGMIDPSWGGQCINQTEIGCSIPDNKPLQCRMLAPLGTIEDRKCHAPKEFNKQAMASLWEEHQTILLKLVLEFNGYENQN